MASGLLLLLDDIATLLDDVAVLTKVAAKKTAGVLGDDLALNAEQVSGVRTDRELPVVWAVAKGSFINKLILVPAALLISAFIPWLITPLLMVGGLYLCFEGVEKVLHKFLHPEDEQENHKKKLEALADKAVNLVELERKKIKGAIRTDFILSAEIIVIALGTVQAQSIVMQTIVVSTIALVVTIGVYGLVAGIVKLDDLGIHLIKNNEEGSAKSVIGKSLLLFAPKLMKALSVLGTIAMFLVGGGIVIHGISYLHHLQESIVHAIENIASWATVFVGIIYPGIVGMIAGAIVLGVVSILTPLIHKIRGKEEGAH